MRHTARNFDNNRGLEIPSEFACVNLEEIVCPFQKVQNPKASKILLFWRTELNITFLENRIELYCEEMHSQITSKDDVIKR